jgi:hypothetical protein
MSLTHWLIAEAIGMRPKAIRAARAVLILAGRRSAARLPPLDVFQRGNVMGDPVGVDRLGNRAVDAVEPNLGLLAPTSKSRARNRVRRCLLPSRSFLVRAGTAQTVLPVGKASTLPRSSFSQSAYLVITSRRRSTAVILR